jgi:hypothetical protein
VKPQVPPLPELLEGEVSMLSIPERTDTEVLGVHWLWESGHQHEGIVRADAPYTVAEHERIRVERRAEPDFARRRALIVVAASLTAPFPAVFSRTLR